jgi:hypothetical protein
MLRSVRSMPRTALTALALLGCSSTSDPGDPGGKDASEASNCFTCSDATIPDDAPLGVQVKGKIDQICANADGCHGMGTGGMGLTPGNEFTQMINVTSAENPPMKRVLPFDPAQSYVYVKLACDGGIPEGGCMPLSTGFDPKLAQLFHDWIEAGAPTQ